MDGNFVQEGLIHFVYMNDILSASLTKAVLLKGKAVSLMEFKSSDKY